MSLTTPDGTRPSLTLAPLPGFEADPPLPPLFRVDPELVVAAAHDPRLSKLPLIAALASGVHDPDELSALASGVRELPVAG